MSSPQWIILQAVKTSLEASSVFSGITVVVRERPFHSAEHGDALPMVCISPEKEKAIGYFMPSGIQIEWPVIVAIFQSKSGAVQNPTAMQDRISYRWGAFQALSPVRNDSVPTQYDSLYDPDPLVDLGALEQNLKVSLQRFSFRTREIRGGAG